MTQRDTEPRFGTEAWMRWRKRQPPDHFPPGWADWSDEQRRQYKAAPDKAAEHLDAQYEALLLDIPKRKK